MRQYLWIWLTITSIIAAAAHAEPITTGSLLREMIDLHNLADFPNPAYKTVQFSSYDHRSTVPGGPEWFANSDGFGREPVPNFEKVIREPSGGKPGEYLICDVKGPGAIVRTWTAAIKGSIRLFLDDMDKPLFDGPAEDFLYRPYEPFSKEAGIESDFYRNSFQQNRAGYAPMPFAKQCRIVWVGNVEEIHFYQVQIRLYEPTADVVTFGPQDVKKYANEIREVGKVLAAPAANWKYASTTAPVEIKADLAPGEVKEVLKLKGPKAVERLTLKLDAKDVDRALRQTVMHVICDDYSWGQVQSPVGDFFGAAPGINPYDSVPFTVEADGTMTSRFVMPFATSMRIVFQNLGRQAVSVNGSVLPMDYQWNDKTSMYFRARWRVDHDLVGAGDAVQDLPFLAARGGGVYVGTTSLLLNPTAIPTPGGGWWGEGDEKIFVDDDVRPSTFGTGSEDYYNYAWSSPDIFFHAYCGQPRNDGPGTRGFVTNNRWHVIDALPFKNSVAFYMELFHHERTPGMSYARVGYHYARPGLIDDHVPITGEDVRPVDLPPNWQPASRGGANNSVYHQAESLVQSPQARLVDGSLYAGGKVLRWEPASKGDELVLTIPIAEAGRYALHLAAALNGESGVISVRMGDKSIMGGERGVIDLCAPGRQMLREFSTGPMDLPKGDLKLTVRYEGPSEKCGGSAVGLDYLRVQRR
ncbi:MAG: DUF2961 domain-containing protein [Phycisphaerae bacterium]|nr:DUF2961 domain-containing protein [Phycisphaerae bacterium]